jgi:hypothetical protein
VPTFTDRGYRLVSTTDPYGRILGFLDWSHYYFFQVAEWTFAVQSFFKYLNMQFLAPRKRSASYL